MSRARLATVLVFALSLIVAALIVTDALPNLRGPAPGTDVWYWPYLLRPLVRWWPALLSAVLLAGSCAWWVLARPGRAWPLALVVALALALQLGLLYADRPNVGGELVDRTLSKDTMGYAAVAGEIADLNAALVDYPALMRVFDNEHARTHPPGLVAAFWVTDHTLRRWPALAEWLAGPVRLWRCTDLWVLARPAATAGSLLIGAWVPLLAAALVPAAGWLVARRLFAAPAVPLAASFAAMIPALLVFVPTPDQVFALLALVSLWAALRGLDQRAPVWLGLAGAVLSLMTFLSVGNAAWAAVVVLYTALGAWRRNWVRREWMWGGVALALGAASLWLVYWLGWGVAPWSIVAVGLDQHYVLVTSERDYVTWLAFNPLDFVLYAGLAVVVGWGWLAGRTLGRPYRLWGEAGVLALLLAGVLLILLLSGSTRGEVGRLWLVFMPLAAVLAAGGWTSASARPDTGLAPVPPLATQPVPVLLLFGAQLVLALAIGLAWRPQQAIILPVVEPPRAALPSELTSLNVRFPVPDGPPVTLTGYTVSPSAQPGGRIGVHLVWTAAGPTFDPYTVFVHVVDTQGTLVAQQDNWPVAGGWPTTCWRPGAVISDPVEVQLPADLAPGEYRVIAGLYGGPEGARLPATTGVNALVLGQVTVAPAQP